MSGAGSSLSHCWEQIDAVDPLYRVTHVFAEAADADRLVAVRALFASLERVVTEVKDEEVALRKLGWWRDALQHRETTGEYHPVIKALVDDGTLQRLDKDHLSRLVDHACRRVRGAPVPDGKALVRFCAESGHLMMALEHQAVSRTAPRVDELSGLKKRRGFAQILRESLAAKTDRYFWWIPLDLQARHGVAKKDFRADEMAVGVQLVFDDVIEQILIDDDADSSNEIDISVYNQFIRTHFSEDAVYRKKFRYAINNSGNMIRIKMDRVRIGDLLSAWKAVRRFNRQK